MSGNLPVIHNKGARRIYNVNNHYPLSAFGDTKNDFTDPPIATNTVLNFLCQIKLCIGFPNSVFKMCSNFYPYKILDRKFAIIESFKNS